MASQIVQYVIVRGDLLSKMEWPVGAVIAQACHACSAAIHLNYSDEHTQAYLKDLDNMHKVVLEVPDQNTLSTIACNLRDNNILHKLWVEKPEDIPTCLAVKPYPKSQIQNYFKKYKLYKFTIPNNVT